MVLALFTVCCSSTRKIKITHEYDETLNTDVDSDTVRSVRITKDSRLGSPTEPIREKILERPIVNPDIDNILVLEIDIDQERTRITTTEGQFDFRTPSPGEELIIKPPEDSSESARLQGFLEGEPEHLTLTKVIEKERGKNWLESISDSLKWGGIILVTLVLAIAGFFVYSQIKTRMLIKHAGKGLVTVLAARGQESESEKS